MTRVYDYCGAFAGDKEAAARIRRQVLIPAIDGGTDEVLILDFDGVEFATQSFIHAMLAEVIRKSPEILDTIGFTNCSRSIRNLIEIVVEYAQEDFTVEDVSERSDEEAYEPLPIDLSSASQDPLF
jgi:hypothetical protein